MLCPCCSGKPYFECCEQYHKHLDTPPTCLALMRSRYSAYALKLAEYIIETTHPQSPYFESNLKRWKQAILHFCQTTKFLKLEILGSGEDWVHFIAYLKQDSDFPMEEKSHFQKLNGQWLYMKKL